MSPQPAHRPTLLIVGCGDIGLRVLRLLRGRVRVLALTSSPQRVAALRAAGAVPLVGNLDDAATLGRLGALAEWVLHLAPPATHGAADARTAALLRVLARGGRVRRLVYVGTTGVYGDCAGGWVDETRRLAPATDRARRRADAESRLRHFGRRTGARVALLRAPGIYALDRAGGDPRERVRRGAPLLAPADDVHTNHIHADDLARACLRALVLAGPQRAFNVCDDSTLSMGDHFDRVADLSGLLRAPRIARAQAAAHFSAVQLSFLSESRRLDNQRLKRELRLVLRYPEVGAALTPLASDAASSSGPRSGP